MIINKHTSLYRKIRKLEFLINHLLNNYLGYKKVKLIPKFQKWGNTLYKAQKTSTKLKTSTIKEQQTPGDKTLGGFLETFNVSTVNKYQLRKFGPF